jgi:hypothetical protein
MTAVESGSSGSKGLGIGRRLCADDRHPRRGDGPDPCHGKPFRSVQAGQRHCRAFVATIYGVGAANLIFLPVAKKLLAIIARIVSLREMLIDGLVGIANGDNPRMLESRLHGYFA